MTARDRSPGAGLTPSERALSGRRAREGREGLRGVETFDPRRMTVYAQVCGYTLARAHARSGDALALAGYLGNGAAMARAMTTFADVYADQNEADYRQFIAQITPAAAASASA